MDTDLLVRHPMVRIQGVDEVLADEGVIEGLLSGLGPVGVREERSRIIDMDHRESVGFLKDFYAALLSVHMLGIPEEPLTAEEGRTLARMAASRIFDAYWFVLNFAASWERPFEAMEMAATGVLAGRRDELIAWLAREPDLTIKPPADGNNAMDWQVLYRMMPCWTRLLGRRNRDDAESALRGLNRLARGAKEWIQVYWEMRRAYPMPNAEGRLDAHLAWASATETTARFARWGLRPQTFSDIRSEFAMAVELASRIDDTRVLNTLVQLYEATRVVAGFEPFADDPDGPIYRGGVEDILR